MSLSSQIHTNAYKFKTHAHTFSPHTHKPTPIPNTQTVSLPQHTLSHTHTHTHLVAVLVRLHAAEGVDGQVVPQVVLAVVGRFYSAAEEQNGLWAGVRPRQDALLIHTAQHLHTAHRRLHTHSTHNVTHTHSTLHTEHKQPRHTECYTHRAPAHRVLHTHLYKLPLFHTHTHKELPKCEVMDMNLIIISQCKCISNHHIVHFKYIQVYLLIFLSKTGNK